MQLVLNFPEAVVLENPKRNLAAFYFGPPSLAKALITPPCAASDSSRKTLYKFDFPLALSPVITFKLPKGIIKLNRDL